MDNVNQFNQDYDDDRQVSMIRPVLFVILGLIVGAGVMALIFVFISGRSEMKNNNEEIQAGITGQIKKDLEDNFSLVFGEDSIIDIYTIEKEGNIMDVSTIIALSEEKFIEIFGISPEGEFATGNVIVAQAEYEMKGGEYVLKGKPKVYWGMDLALMQESLGTSKEKATDVSIKGELSSMRTMAELWAMDHSDSYKGFCYGTDAQKSIAYIAEDGKKVLCADSYNTWAAFSPLYSSDEKCWCVDSSGTSAALYKSCPLKAVTVCP